MRTVTFTALLLLLGAACSVEDSPNRRTAPTTTAQSVPTTPQAPLEIEVIEPTSVGLVTVGEQSYSLGFDCYAAGAGEILAIGVAVDPITEVRAEAYVQAFLGAPYLGIELTPPGGEPVLYEASLERPLEFALADDVLRADDVELVTDLDLEAHTATPAGTGSVVVECWEYFDELPDEFAT